MAKTNPKAQEQVNGTQIEDQDLQRRRRSIPDQKPPDYLRDAIEDGDEQRPGKSIQRVIASGQRQVPTIPEHPSIHKEQGSQGQPDINGRLPQKFRTPQVKDNQLGPVVKV